MSPLKTHFKLFALFLMNLVLISCHQGDKQPEEKELDQSAKEDLSPLYKLQLQAANLIMTEKYDSAKTLVYTFLQQTDDSLLNILGYQMLVDISYSIKNKHDTFAYFDTLMSMENDIYTFNSRGYYYIRYKDYKKAEKDLQMALSIDSSFAYPWSNLGLLYTLKKEYNKAKGYLIRATQLDPSNPYIFKHYGIYYLAKGHTLKACECFHTSIEKGYKNRALPVERNGIDSLIKLHCPDEKDVQALDIEKLEI